MGVALGSWSDNKQRTVSASTNAAGYIALIHASREGVDTSLLERDGLGRDYRDYVEGWR